MHCNLMDGEISILLPLFFVMIFMYSSLEAVVLGTVSRLSLSICQS